MKWKNTDPREEGRSDIIILRPSLSGFNSKIVGLGFVDVKTGWSILTSFEDHKLIGADDKWDNTWTWIHEKNDINATTAEIIDKCNHALNPSYCFSKEDLFNIILAIRKISKKL